MTAPLRARPTSRHDGAKLATPKPPDTKPARAKSLHVRPAGPTPADGPAEAGFVLYVGVDASFGTGPQALADLVEAAETLQELARDLLPQADTRTTLALTPPTAR